LFNKWFSACSEEKYIMCGIIGVASINAVFNKKWLTKGRDAMWHRGPDSEGEWWSLDHKVGMAHRRLSIVDISNAGHQPMIDSTGSYSIVFNGEIYNYKIIKNSLIKLGYQFTSNTDSEVILQAYIEWGNDCLSKLNGMFAFSIYDSIKNVVFLARDRAGEKPLFYYRDATSIRYSSELKGLLSDEYLKRVIDHSALDAYLAIGFVPGDMCILDGFNKLPPGHALEFDLTTGGVEIWKYWDVPILDSETNDDEYILNCLESLLEDSVSQQLHADVPVGVLLSGGVDSSLVTAMAARSSGKVKTYTIGFPGAGRLDETKHAQLIANYFGTEHTQLDLGPAHADLIHLLANQYDEPIIDSSMLPTYMVSELISGQCKVALGGDGADELFGGYGHHSGVLKLHKRVSFLPKYIRNSIAYLSDNYLPVGFKGREYFRSIGVDFQSGLPWLATYFDSKSRKKLMSSVSGWGGGAEELAYSRTVSQNDLLQRATRTDFSNYLPEDILVKVDRASMLNSLEVRSPFLDRRIIEFAYGKVPSRLKATVNDKKILLKRLTERILPPEFDRNRKQGFSIPLAKWLEQGEFRSLFYDVLLDSQSIFDGHYVKTLLHNQDRGYGNGERLFGLVLFELWRREYSVSL